MSNIRLKPSPGFMLIKITDEVQSNDLVMVADKEGDRPHEGVVISVGDSTIHSSGDPYPCPVSVDDKIIFKPFGVEDVKLEGRDYMLIPFDNVRAVIINE